MSRRFAEKNNYPVLEHVTLPRMGAIQVIMDSLGANSSRTRSEIPNNSKLASFYYVAVAKYIGNALSVSHGCLFGIISAKPVEYFPEIGRVKILNS